MIKIKDRNDSYDEEFLAYSSYARTRKIFNTKHAIERFHNENRFDLDAIGWNKSEFIDKILWVINNGIKQIINKYNDKSIPYGAYLIHSESTGIGIVGDWRRDSKNIVDYQNHFFIITILPIKPKHFKKNKDDKAITVEQQLTIWAKKFLKRKICEKKFTFDHAKLGTFDVAFWEGKFYDTTATIIIVK